MTVPYTTYEHGVTGNVGLAVPVTPGPPTYTNFRATSWGINFQVDLDDASGFLSGGWKEYAIGLLGGDGSISFTPNDVDGDYFPETGVTLKPGTVLACELQTVAGVTYTGNAIVKGMNVKVDVKGRITYDADITTHGPWTFPTAGE
jgi:hypothetical protein